MQPQNHNKLKTQQESCFHLLKPRKKMTAEQQAPLAWAINQSLLSQAASVEKQIHDLVWENSG